MNNKILVPTDGSESSLKAGEYALSLAAENVSEILLLYIIDTSTGDRMKRGEGYLEAIPQRDLREQMDKQLRDEGKKAVENFRKKLEEIRSSGNFADVNLTTSVKEGKPSEVILQTINDEKIDQVVIGRSEQDEIEKFVLGDIAEQIENETNVQIHVIKS